MLAARGHLTSIRSGSSELRCQAIAYSSRNARSSCTGGVIGVNTAAATAAAPAPRPRRRRDVSAAAAAAAAGKGFGAPKKAAPASPSAASPSSKCPCGSGKSYAACCAREHGGEPAASPERLLRSRFSAYALGLVDYLVATTHPRNPERAGMSDRAYAKSVKVTARMNNFLALKVGLRFVRGDGCERATHTRKLPKHPTPHTPPPPTCTHTQPNARTHANTRTRPPRGDGQIDEHEAGAGDDEAFIKFTVTSRPNAPGSQGKPADTQRERSHFVREDGRWLYFDFK